MSVERAYKFGEGDEGLERIRALDRTLHPSYPESFRSPMEKTRLGYIYSVIVEYERMQAKQRAQEQQEEGT